MTEIKIVQEIKNPLFKRKEVIFQIESNITPSRADISELISKKFSTDENKVKIKRIIGKFGSKIFSISAFLYDSKEEKDALERKKKKELDLEKKNSEKAVLEESLEKNIEEEIK